MEERIMYVERKNGPEHDGPAWIGKVKFSRTGRTAYFNGRAFKHAGKGNYGDFESGDSYWISGVKKNGQDRHWAGRGKIMIDRTIVKEYLEMVDFDKLDLNRFELVDIISTDVERLNRLENEKLNKAAQ